MMLDEGLDDRLVQIVDAALTDAALRAGPHLVCHAGCSQCCVGVFPVAQQDAERLRVGLAELSVREPERADRIRLRVVDALTRLDPWFPGDLDSGVLNEDHESAILFEEFANDEVCPVLDPWSGTCDLYAARPLLCRTFGPPMRTPEDNLGTCELCFIHASTEEIAACELDPAIPAMQEASDEAYNERVGCSGETLIAYALRGV